MTPDVSSDFDPLDEPAEEFLTRYRRGERPPLTEYAERYPNLADRIRALFPALVEMEQVGGPPDDAPPTPSPSGGVPARVGEFRILRKVGEGGMGVVYEAVQESLGRHVALKVLAPNRPGSYLERFRREARAAAKLHHTNIVPVFGVGEADGLHFYAMQFIPGQGLDTVLDEVRRLRSARSGATERPAGQVGSGVAHTVALSMVTGTFAPAAEPAAVLPPLPPPGPRDNRTELATHTEARYYREVARIGVQVAESLAHAHAQGVLHRDIKPSNLLLDLHGTAWVTDFGLAKADDEQDLTRTGDIVGTLRYMAPERFRGTADARSDVYALGVTLYELLTLRPPFGGSDRAALIRDVCHADPPRPRKLDPHIPRDLETIVLKATAREPADRYATAAELADDLRRFLADRSITARRASAVEQLQRWARRNPVVAALATVIVIGSVTATAGFAVQNARLQAALTASEKSGKAATDSRREAQLKRLDSMIAEAKSKTLSRKPGQRFESLALLDEAAALAGELGVLEEKTPELRNAVAAALAVTDLHLGRTWDGFPKGSEYFDISGDHTVYAQTHENGTCVVTRVADNTEVCRVPATPTVADHWCMPVLSRDGRTILLYRLNGEAHVWRVGPPPARVTDVKDVYHANLRPDGRRVVFTHTDGSLSVCDLDGAPTIVRFPPAGQTKEWGCVPHPTEPRVALWADVEGVLVRDTRTGEVVARFLGHAATSVAWHPAGTTLAVATSEPAIRLYEADRETYRERAVWPVASALAPIAYNPSGDRLAGVSSWDATTCIIDTHTGRTVHVGPPFRDGTVLRWSPDGRRLAGPILGDRLGIWNIGDGREFRVLHKPTAAARTSYSRTAVHRDGRLVAAPVGTDIALWDLETGRHLADLPLGSMPWLPVFDHTGALWTPAMDRTLRWRVAETADRPGRYTIGPPERVPIDPGGLARSSDGQLWVGVDRFRPDAFVWRPDRPYDRASLPAGRDKAHVDVSPNGRWAVIAHHTTHTADLWDVQERRPVQRLYNRSGNAVAAFSPNGKWLWVNADGGRLFHVGTWEPGPATGRGEGRPAFTADGVVMALETGAGSVRLLETETGKELARLDNPHQDPLSGLAFTPDGGRLVGCSNRNVPGVHVWDLRLIRRQLAVRGLDWAAPPLSDAPAAGPVEVRVPIATPAETPPRDENPFVTAARMTGYLVHDPELADPHHHRAHAWARLGWTARAEADFDEAVRLRPNEPTALRCRAEFYFAGRRYAEAAADLDRILADAPSWSPPGGLLARVALWHLALAPPDRQDGPKGHELARRAAEADPDSGDALYRVTVGLGLLRTGQPAIAIAVLGEARGGRYDAVVHPALALAHLALGDRPRAADALRQGAEAGASARGYLRAAHDQLRAEAAARWPDAVPNHWPALR